MQCYHYLIVSFEIHLASVYWELLRTYCTCLENNAYPHKAHRLGQGCTKTCNPLIRATRQGSIEVSVSNKRIYLTLMRNSETFQLGLDNQKEKFVQTEEQRQIHRIAHHLVALRAQVLSGQERALAWR